MNGNDVFEHFEKQWESLYTEFYDKEPEDFDTALNAYDDDEEFTRYVEEACSESFHGYEAKMEGAYPNNC